MPRGVQTFVYVKEGRFRVVVENDPTMFKQAIIDAQHSFNTSNIDLISFPDSVWVPGYFVRELGGWRLLLFVLFVWKKYLIASAILLYLLIKYV